MAVLFDLRRDVTHLSVESRGDIYVMWHTLCDRLIWQAVCVIYRGHQGGFGARQISVMHFFVVMNSI